MALLQFLAAHPNQVLRRETLLENVWQGVTVNDNTLSKSIAELRKALGDESRQARYIATIPRRGYQLIALVGQNEPANASIPAPPGVVAEPDNTARKPVLWFISLAFLVTSVMGGYWLLSARIAPEAQTQTRFTRLVPATTRKGMEFQPSFSPDGQWLAYANMEEQGINVVLEQLSNGKRHVIGDGRVRREQPSWSPDGQFLAYLLFENDRCQVHLVRLAAVTNAVVEDQMVAECAMQSPIGFNAVRWSHDSQFLYFFAQHDHRVVLTQFNWRTKNAISLDDLTAYVFAPHPKAPKLAYAKASPMSTALYVFDADKNVSTPYHSRNEVFIGLSVDPLTEHIVSVSNLVGGQLEIISPQGQSSVLWPSADPLIDPSFSADGKRLAVTRVQFTYDLWSVDLITTNQATRPNNASQKPLIESSRFDYSPQFAHSGTRLAFISTRSGAPAVWFCQQDGSEPKQLFQLPEAVWPTHIRWSHDDRFLSIGTSDLRVYVFDTVSGELRAIDQSLGQIMNPNWSHDDRSLYVSRYTQDTWQIWQIPLAHQQKAISLQDANGHALEASMAQSHGDHAHLYLLRHGNSEQRGIWRYSLQDKSMARITAQGARRGNWQNFSVNNNGFYFVEDENGMLTVKHGKDDGSLASVMPIFPTADAGMLFIDFAIDPTVSRLLFTRLDDFESDIMVLE